MRRRNRGGVARNRAVYVGIFRATLAPFHILAARPTRRFGEVLNAYPSRTCPRDVHFPWSLNSLPEAATAAWFGTFLLRRLHPGASFVAAALPTQIQTASAAVAFFFLGSSLSLFLFFFFDAAEGKHPRARKSTERKTGKGSLCHTSSGCADSFYLL